MSEILKQIDILQQKTDKENKIDFDVVHEALVYAEGIRLGEQVELQVSEVKIKAQNTQLKRDFRDITKILKDKNFSLFERMSKTMRIAQVNCISHDDNNSPDKN